MDDWRKNLAEGLVIPALPLALHHDGSWSKPHQEALLRYYIDAGAGGIAAAVHSTQFEIREPQHDLYAPVLRLSAEVIESFAEPDFVRIAGICGPTEQAKTEARLAGSIGFHAGLLSLTAFNDQSDSAALDHVREIAKIIPVIGFYLQPAVGGRICRYDFWRQFCDIENVIAIKIAPFNRYYTFDVIRAAIESGREDLILYTGNDDNIIADLLTPFAWRGQTRYIMGGLLGQWGVWTRRAVEMLEEIKTLRKSEHPNEIPLEWLTLNAKLTDANAAIFDTANQFSGCIPGILEILRRQGLVPSNRCLDPKLQLSPGQAEELNRVCRAYPELIDDDFVNDHLKNWLKAP